MMNRKETLEEFFNSMLQMKKLFMSQSQESLEEKAATMMQGAALRFLKNSQTKTVGDLARDMRMSKSSATQLIERLVKAELVTRTSGTDDRRIIHVMITTAGREKLIEQKKKMIERMENLLTNISDDDLQELVRLHKKLITTLEEKY